MLRQRVVHTRHDVPGIAPKKTMMNRSGSHWRRKEALLNKPHKYKSTVINVIFGGQHSRRQTAEGKGR